MIGAEGAGGGLYALAVMVLMVVSLFYFVRRFDQTRRRDAYFKAVAAKSVGPSARLAAAVKSRERGVLSEASRRRRSAIDFILPSSIRSDMIRSGLPGQASLVVIVASVLAWLIAFLVIAAPIFPIWVQTLAIWPLLFYFVRSGILGILYELRRLVLMDQLITFIEHVQRGVTVGTSPDIAVVEAIEEMPQPLRGYLQAVKDLIEIGYDFVEAISMASDRIDLPEFDIFAASLSAQAASGGPIGDVLREVAGIARMRLDLTRKVGTLTAEGRFNAIVLGVLPVGLMLYLRHAQPDYFNHLWTGTVWWGPWLYFGTLAAALVGAWSALKIAAIKV